MGCSYRALVFLLPQLGMAVAALQRAGPQVMFGEPRALHHWLQCCFATCCHPVRTWWRWGALLSLLLLLLLLLLSNAS